MTAVGFEPTPLRTGALSQRLRPLGQTVLDGVKTDSRSARHTRTQRTSLRARGPMPESYTVARSTTHVGGVRTHDLRTLWASAMLDVDLEAKYSNRLWCAHIHNHCMHN